MRPNLQSLVDDPLAMLLFSGLTVVVYVAALALFRRCRQAPATNPVLVSVALLGTILLLLDIPYPRYSTGTGPLQLLLGPATVALAVPLHAQLHRIRTATIPLLGLLSLGAVGGIVSSALPAKWLGASEEVLLSLALKGITTPIAMNVAEQLGGSPSLTAVLVILTGVLCAIVGPPLLSLLDVRSSAARGFALGLTGHGIATAQSFLEDEEAGAFAGLALGLNGIATALLAPLLVPWLLIG